MKECIILIKLGGSLITDKEKPLTFQGKYIRRIAKELYELKQKTAIDFIIGTGAGSFGHFTAHKYGLRSGAKTLRQLYGASLTHNDVQKLSGLVAQELTSKKLPVFTMSPSALFVSDNERLKSANFKPLRALLDSNIIPLVHGDMINDTTRGMSIFSTEKVLQACLEELRPDYKKVVVLYVQDVEGVLDKNGTVISEIGAHDEVLVRSQFAHDVTGGIIGKIQSARKAALQADEVYIISGKVSRAISNVITGVDSVGTRIIG